MWNYSIRLGRRPLHLHSETKVSLKPSVVSLCSILISSRFTDFLVNEIQSSGQVLHLDQSALLNSERRHDHMKEKAQESENQNNTSAHKPEDTAAPATGSNVADPEPEPKPVLAETTIAQDETTSSADHGLASDDIAKVQTIFGEKLATAMCTLYAKIKSHPDRKAREFSQLQSDVIPSKQSRTDAHIIVRNVFKGLLQTMTDDDNRIIIKSSGVRSSARDSRARNNDIGRRPPKVSWTDQGGEYLHFTLYKENKDTMQVLHFLAGKLKIQSDKFSVAGTKDRRGVSVQRVAALRIHADRIKGVCHALRGCRIGAYTYERAPLRIGGLVGNEFLLTLRDCRAPDDGSLDMQARLAKLRQGLDKSVESLRAHGYINYFGLQRFGAYSSGTHDTGRLMLQGDLEGAVASILYVSPAILKEAQDPSEDSKLPQDDRLRALALHEWHSTHKVGAMIEQLPGRFQAEHAVIRFLGSASRGAHAKRPDEWQGALRSIQYNLRTMYVHAYQSTVFNHAAARRIEKHGFKVIEGDLVIVDPNDSRNAEKLEDVDDQGEVIIRPSIDRSNAPVVDHERARPLSKQEVESGKYTVRDIVLPLPGYDIVYPTNEIGEFYKEFMAKDKLDPHNMRRAWKDVSLCGGYRKVVARPLQISYELKTYAHEDEQLVQTDLERLIAEAAGSKENGSNGHVDVAEGDKKDKFALLLKMQLGSSQYATMALRELTRGGALGFKPEFSADR